jgi:hypothetical protein
MNRDNETEEAVTVSEDPQDFAASAMNVPYNLESFSQIGVIDTWREDEAKLRWGKGQCLAILDDGCNLADPPWQVEMPWGRKVIASYNSIDVNDDPTPIPPGYHGTSVGYPSSMNHDGVVGVAYNDYVAQVRCVTIVHLDGQDEAPTMAKELQWVLDNSERYNITAVNLSPLDDERHREPVGTVIDEKLTALRERGIWVGAPCGNHGYIDGVSWPACQPNCFGIGATVPGKREVHLDRYSNTDLLVAAQATSSSNAYAAACSMILREAIAKAGYSWQNDAENISDAMMKLFRKTGVVIEDSESGIQFRELDLLAAVNSVFNTSNG